MNTKTIYTILAVIIIAFLGYYFISNQPSTNQLPINNNTNQPITAEPIQNEPGDAVLPSNDDEYLTYASDSYDIVVNIYKSPSELPNNPDRLDFEGWIGQISEDPTFTNKTEIMVDEVKGYQGVSHGMFSSYTIHVENDGLIYSVYINNSVLPGIVEQAIINSFRFI